MQDMSQLDHVRRRFPPQVSLGFRICFRVELRALERLLHLADLRAELRRVLIGSGKLEVEIIPFFSEPFDFLSCSVETIIQFGRRCEPLLCGRFLPC